MSINEMSVEEETKIEDISNALYWRIEKETERLLKSQLQALGVNIDDHDIISKRCRKVTYQDDDLSLASYEYNGVKILGVRIGEGRMSIEFDVPELKQTPKYTLDQYHGSIKLADNIDEFLKDHEPLCHKNRAQLNPGIENRCTCFNPPESQGGSE